MPQNDVVLYGLTTCDTCRKARRAVPQAVFVDVRSDGVPVPVLKKAFELFGEKLVNTRSTTWRGLSAQERASDPLGLLQEHPTLMKRPLITTADTYYLGWDSQTQAALSPAVDQAE